MSGHPRRRRCRRGGCNVDPCPRVVWNTSNVLYIVKKPTVMAISAPCLPYRPYLRPQHAEDLAALAKNETLQKNDPRCNGFPAFLQAPAVLVNTLRLLGRHRRLPHAHREEAKAEAHGGPRLCGEHVLCGARLRAILCTFQTVWHRASTATRVRRERWEVTCCGSMLRMASVVYENRHLNVGDELDERQLENRSWFWPCVILETGYLHTPTIMFTFFVTLTLLVSCTAMPGHDGANGTCKNLNGSPMSPDASSHAGHGHHRQLHGGEGYKKIAHARSYSYGLVLLARTHERGIPVA